MTSNTLEIGFRWGTVCIYEGEIRGERGRGTGLKKESKVRRETELSGRNSSLTARLFGDRTSGEHYRGGSENEEMTVIFRAYKQRRVETSWYKHVKLVTRLPNVLARSYYLGLARSSRTRVFVLSER